MGNERISVIVPAYNCAQWLPRCIDSLLAQTYDDLEIVVVDDGSTDNTQAVLESYRQKTDKLQILYQQNAGVTVARMAGVRAATGAWIGFVDGDDVVQPEMYENLYRKAEKFGVDISHCGFQIIWPDGAVEKHCGTSVLRIQNHQMALQDLLAEELVEPSLCTKLFRRYLFAELEDKMPVSIKNNEDMLMNYFLFEKAETAVFEDVCPYHYLIREFSASRRKLNQCMIYDPIRVRQIILDQCEPEIKTDARRALARMCLVSYRQLVMEDKKEYAADRRKVRQLISEQLPYVSVLPKRNGILVRMVAYVPWLFDFLYPLAAKVLGRE